eukprot:EG_transcript_997
MIPWLVVLLLLCCVRWAAAVNATHIVIGQTIALTGPTASAGNRSGFGLRAAFQEANDAGGVNSRNVTLVQLDDKNQGPLAIQNLITLNATHDALLLTAPYSDVPFDAVLPTLVEWRMPVVGPLAGLSSTRTPFQDVVINIRPSFADEAVALARFLVEYLRVQRVACFYTNDEMGYGGFSTLSAALDSVGMSLVASAVYVKNVTAPNITAPMEVILSAKQKPQAVMLVCLEPDIAQFILMYRQDPRADPNCSFVFLSVSSAASLSGRLGPKNWYNIYFSRTVPMPDANYDLSRRFNDVVAKYIPAEFLTDQLTFESYIVGRFIVEALKGTGSWHLDRNKFLDAVYNTHLYYLDDVPVGLYGRNFSGCEFSICACNSGMRRVFIATLDPLTGRAASYARFPTAQYALTQCAASNSLIRRPILFGQLIPTDDPLVLRVARILSSALETAFVDINAAGGLNGRQFELVTAEYSGDPANATAALVDRWPLVALLGSVVANGVTLPAGIPRIGTFDLTVESTEPAYVYDDVRIQSTIPLEMMALAGYVAEQQRTTAHFRVRRSATSAALLATLTKSFNTFQRVPASAVEFDSAHAALDGLSSGYVIGIGSNQDMLDWVALLEDRPGLTLLTVKPCAILLQTSGLINGSAGALQRLQYPYVVRSDAVDSDDKTLPWTYGYNLGAIITKVLNQSVVTLSATSTAPADIIKAWYDVQVIKLQNVVFGPYSANCTSPSDTTCQCNLGARSVAIVSANTRSSVVYRFATPTCHVQYSPLQLQPSSASSSVTLAAVLGAVLSTAFVLTVLGAAALRSRRNNWAAPKNPAQPFCIIFTDIQASTTLWATVPNDMAPALDAHHCLIRKLIRKFNCYEVKTIGDSFMCATKSPVQALRFALALQHAFHEYDWGTHAFDDAYDAMLTEEVRMPECWNGLRVRVGIHYGKGNIKLDPVSHGYDYYGTVVNTAARIESVCHGGQVCVSEAVHRLVHGHVPGTVWTDLGPQELRGLSEPLHLHQVLPEGLLAERRFPPLRISRVDNREEAYVDDGDMSSSNCSLSGLKHDKHGVVPCSDSLSNYCAAGKWAEVHPLVVKGEATVEELRRHYAILQTGLSTLLASQTKQIKQQMLRQLCDRMHVTDHGAEGLQLQKTLHGLIGRVLPATIVQQLHRRPSSKLSSPSHRTPAHDSMPGRTRQRSASQDCVVDVPS